MFDQSSSIVLFAGAGGADRESFGQVRQLRPFEFSQDIMIAGCPNEASALTGQELDQIASQAWGASSKSHGGVILVAEDLLCTPTFVPVRQVDQPGFRVDSFVVVTTLTDAHEYSRDDLAELYHQRWLAELDLRTIKSTLGLDVLRCKSPEMVRREIWTGLLAYNLIRQTMLQAALQAGHSPRQLSCGLAEDRCRLGHDRGVSECAGAGVDRSSPRRHGDAPSRRPPPSGRTTQS